MATTPLSNPTPLTQAQLQRKDPFLSPPLIGTQQPNGQQRLAQALGGAGSTVARTGPAPTGFAATGATAPQSFSIGAFKAAPKAGQFDSPPLIGQQPAGAQQLASALSSAAPNMRATGFSDGATGTRLEDQPRSNFGSTGKTKPSPSPNTGIVPPGFQSTPSVPTPPTATPDVFATQAPQTGSFPINSAPQVFAPAGAQPTFQQSGSFNPSQPSAPAQLPTFQQGGSFTPTTAPAATQLPGFAQSPDAVRNFTPSAINAPSVGASRASAQTFDFAGFQPFADAVLAEQNRTLDPQLRADEAAFRQRLVGQGIQEGTRAFDDAFANFSRSQNDARSSARNQALAQALAVQNQTFGQSLANSQLAQQASLANASNALQAAGLNQQDRQFGANLGLQSQGQENQFNLARSQLGEGQRQFDAGFGAQQAQFGANFGLQQQNAANQFGLSAAQLGEGARQFDSSLGSQERQFSANFDSRQAELANAFAQQNATRGEQSRQFDSSLGFNQQRADIGDLTSLFGLGTGTINQNNINQQNDFIRQLQLLGLAPGAIGTPAIDVNTPFAQQLAQQNLQTQAKAANNQAFNQGLAGIGSAIGSAFGGPSSSFSCSRELKNEEAEVSPDAAMAAIRTIPLVRYNYKADPEKRQHIMTYAEDFHVALGLEPRADIPFTTMMGVIVGALKNIDERMAGIEARLSAKEASA